MEENTTRTQDQDSGGGNARRRTVGEHQEKNRTGKTSTNSNSRAGVNSVTGAGPEKCERCLERVQTRPDHRLRDSSDTPYGRPARGRKTQERRASKLNNSGEAHGKGTESRPEGSRRWTQVSAGEREKKGQGRVGCKRAGKRGKGKNSCGEKGRHGCGEGTTRESRRRAAKPHRRRTGAPGGDTSKRRGASNSGRARSEIAKDHHPRQNTAVCRAREAGA